jgi:SAM-dependent methyltransferase
VEETNPTLQPEQTQSDSFYTRYYAAVASSRANGIYCERLFGANFCQHGFCELTHLNHLVQVTGLRVGLRALDLGCGNGGIAEYIADQSGAHVTGIDLVPDAIRQAWPRAQAKPGLLRFQVMDIARLDFPEAAFDVILAIDTLYFTPLAETLSDLVRLLKPGGCMGIFWSQGADPWVPVDVFDRATCHPDCTELAVELQRLGLAYQTWDYGRIDYEHARRKQQIAEELRPQFEAEGSLFLCEDHLAEARWVQEAFEAGAHARYLYRVDV